MAHRNASVRTIRHGWIDPFDRRGPKPAVKPVSAEAAARRRAESDALTNRMLSEMAANHSLARIKNDEARKAVEGDTDLNHDNFEAAK